MGAFAIVFISVLLIGELHFTSTIPVSQLSGKQLCELLCEHCNGVSSMESGHCNCEVPEAHFKDNSPCLERAQMSAAEMNLKLTHHKSIRRERSVNDFAGRIISNALEDAQINYLQGYNKISDGSLTPPTLNPMDVNEYEYPTSEHKEVFVKRSITNVLDPELEKVDGYREQSHEKKSFKKRSINYFQLASIGIDAMHNKTALTTLPTSRLLSGSDSNLRSTRPSVFYPQRKKRSYTKQVQFARNEDGTISHRESKDSNENYDVIVNVKADIAIPALKAKQIDNENMNSKLQANDDLQSQVSPPLVPDNSTIIKSDPSHSGLKSFQRNKGDFESSISFPKSETPNTTDALVSNKSRGAVEGTILNDAESDASRPTDFIDNSNKLLLESKPGLPSLATLKLPTLLSRCKLRSLNENKISQMNKIGEIRSKLEKLLWPREQPRIPLQGLLQTKDLLKDPKSSLAITDNNPFAKIVIPKCSTQLDRSKNTLLGDLLTKATANDLKLKDQGEGMTLLEKIKNNQLKLKQNLLRIKSEQSFAQNRDASECQFENENSDLPLKLNPSVPTETRSHESIIDCDDEDNDDVAAPMQSIDKSRSNSHKSESVGEEIRTTDTPVILPVSHESRSRTLNPAVFSGNSFVPTALPNEPITVNGGKIGLINETDQEGNVNKSIMDIGQLTSESMKERNDSNVSPIKLGLADISITIHTSDSKSAPNDSPSSDSNDNRHPTKLQEPFAVDHVEAVPADVSSSAPVLGLEPHTMQNEEPSRTPNDNIMVPKVTPSNHPHFVNHNENDNRHPTKLQEPFIVDNVEAVPADVSSSTPVLGLEPHTMQNEEPSRTPNDNIMVPKVTPSNHPHFVNYNENLLPKAPSYFSPVFMAPALGNNIRMSPGETYRGMSDPALFRNDMQRIYYPALLARNGLSNTDRDSVLNRPVVMVPNAIIPFDHPSRLTGNFNGAMDHPNNPLLNEQSGMVMKAFVPSESYSNNPAELPPSSVFILKPLLTPDGKIPYPELLNQIRTGNAVIQIYPINPNNVDNSGK